MKITVENLKIIIDKLNENIVNKQIDDIKNISNNAFVFNFFGNKSIQLIVSLNQDCPYVYYINSIRKKAPEQKFVKQLKQKLIGAIIVSFAIINSDRIIDIKFNVTNSMYKNESYHLIIELFPKHVYAVLCDGTNKIVFNSKKLLTNTSSKYVAPSKLLFTTSVDNAFVLNDYISSINSDVKNIISNDELKEKYTKRIEKENAKLEEKIKILKIDLDNANISLLYKEAADQLIIDGDKKQNKVLVQGHEFLLDPKYSFTDNIQIFYKKYKSARNALKQIPEQIRIAQEQIEQNRDSLLHIDEADSEELKEIESFSKDKNKQAKNIINHYYFEINDNGTKYIFGKNSAQNETISFKIAKRNNYWFHIKDIHGSHLVVRLEKRPSDNIIQTACELVVLLSKKSDGDVTYTKLSNIKKAGKEGLVKMKNYETCHIKNISEKTKKLLQSAIKKSI